MMKRRHFLAGAAALMTSPWHAWAQPSSLPEGQIRIFVGWAPGGGTDTFARIISQKLGERWGKAVVVENKPGATGMLAAGYFANTEFREGINLLITHVNTHAIAPHLFQSRINYDALKDFTPIVSIGATPHLLVTSVDNPVDSVQEIVEACRAAPGKVTFGSSGVGSVQHLAIAMFNAAADVQGLHVPYKGSGPMHSDMMGRQIGYSFDTMTASAPHVQGGRFKALAQTRMTRTKSFPDLPTMDELGFKNYDASSWYGVSGPSGMPAEIVQMLNEEINAVLAMPDVVERFEGYGVEDGGGSAEKFAGFMQDEYAKWGEVVRVAGVTAEG